MSRPEVTVEQLRDELHKLKVDLTALDTSALGDRRDREAYKRSLQGRVEVMEAQVEDLAEAVQGFRGVFNKGVSGFLMALVAGLAGWIFSRLTGGG